MLDETKPTEPTNAAATPERAPDESKHKMNPPCMGKSQKRRRRATSVLYRRHGHQAIFLSDCYKVKVR